jgi:hypothetical protein
LTDATATLTAEQAFDAMVCFLTKISDNTRGSYPVAVILADCARSWPDGVTTGDPAAWTDWLDCVERVLGADSN